jgi:hypothetical protein
MKSFFYQQMLVEFVVMIPACGRLEHLFLWFCCSDLKFDISSCSQPPALGRPPAHGSGEKNVFDAMFGIHKFPIRERVDLFFFVKRFFAINLG